MDIVVQLAPISTSNIINLNVSLMDGDGTLVYGVKGGIAHASMAKAYLDELGLTAGTKVTTGGALDELTATADAFMYLAGADQQQFAALLGQFMDMYDAAVMEVEDIEALPQHKAYPLALLRSAF
jgi:hypothetical protein